MEFSIREAETLEDALATEELQVAAWNFSDREVVPHSSMIVARHTGGLVALAWVGDRPAGFVYGLAAYEGNRRWQHSHMLAVHPDFRGTGIAPALKWFQRDWALRHGIDLVTWTFDPLLTRNARLNFGKLGAYADTYYEDFYGIRTGLYAGLPADRLYVKWELNHPRVVKLPLDVKAVGGETGVEAGADAVEVFVVGVGVGPELAEVEPGVPGKQGVEGPGHQVDAVSKRPVPLKPLEGGGDAGAPEIRVHRQHVGVLPPTVPLVGGQAVHEARRSIAHPGESHQPAGVAGDDHRGVRNHLAVRKVPGGDLELLGGQGVLQGFGLADRKLHALSLTGRLVPVAGMG